jgi:hypothetical protein
LVKVLEIELLPLEQREGVPVCQERAGIDSARSFSRNGIRSAPRSPGYATVPGGGAPRLHRAKVPRLP